MSQSEIDNSLRRRGRPPGAGAEPAGEVQSLDRAAAILEVLAEGDGTGLGEVARRLALPTSTVHRLVATLEKREFVKLNADTGLWTVGVGLFRIGCAYLRVRKLPEIGWPIIRELNLRLNETVNLTLRDDRDVVCVAQAESHEPVRAFFRLGSHLPVHASGAGKAMLAALPRERQDDWLSHADYRRFTDRTHTDGAALHADLAVSRQRGFAVDDEEHAVGMRCVAAAILDENGAPVGAVSVSAPTIRMPPERLEVLGEAVRSAAARLTALYSGCGL